MLLFTMLVSRFSREESKMDLSFHSSFAWNYNMFTLDVHLFGCVLETEKASLRLPKTEKWVAQPYVQTVTILRTFVVGHELCSLCMWYLGTTRWRDSLHLKGPARAQEGVCTWQWNGKISKLAGWRATRSALDIHTKCQPGEVGLYF